MDRKTEDRGRKTDGTAELKPCPFCGQAARLVRNDGLTHIVCADGEQTCKGSGLITCCFTEQEVSAVEAWNRRTPSERDEFAQILAGLKARGVITQADVDRLDRDGLKEVADA